MPQGSGCPPTAPLTSWLTRVAASASRSSTRAALVWKTCWTGSSRGTPLTPSPESSRSRRSRWKRPSGRRVDSPPEFFIDRSLGAIEVPETLRAAGLVVHTMREVYGETWGQRVDDETWLADVAAAGWVALHKDDRIRRRPAQLAAVERFGLRVFCLTNGNLRGADQAAWLLFNRHRIVHAA